MFRFVLGCRGCRYIFKLLFLIWGSVVGLVWLCIIVFWYVFWGVIDECVGVGVWCVVGVGLLVLGW